MRFKYYLRGAGIGVIAATLILSVAFLFHDNISDEEVIRRAMKLGMIMQENTSGTLADPPQSGASSVDLETGTDPDPLTEPDGADQSSDQPSEPDVGADTGQSSDPQAGGNPGDSSDGNAGGDTSQPSDGDANGDAGKPSEPKADEKTDPPSDSKSDDSSKDKSKDQEKDKSPDTKTEDSKPENSDEVEIVIASGDVSRMVSAKVFEAGLVDDADEFNSYLGSHDYDNMLQPGTYKIKKGSSFQQIAKILTRQ